ncbi:MAG: TatD family hydrolase, partial [Nitrospira sp.]|nr:TatD family hydrolase [Nitrospira sp.]
AARRSRAADSAPIPVESLLVETDCPYLAPIPHRGKRNEPSYVRHVAEKLSQLKALPYEDLTRLTTQNTRKLFKKIA